MDTACFTFDVGVSASYAAILLSEHSSNFTGNPNRISMASVSCRAGMPL